MVDWLCSVACAMFSTKNCILPPFLAFPWNSSCQFEKEKTTLIILLNSEIASTFICYMIFAQKCLKLAFFSCKMLFSAPKQPSFVDDTVCLTCWQAGKKGRNPWGFTPAAENLKFFFPPVGPFFNHTPPDPRNLALSICDFSVSWNCEKSVRNLWENQGLHLYMWTICEMYYSLGACMWAKCGV